MADNTTQPNGSIIGMIATVLAWIWSKITVSDVSGIIAICVGLSTLVINWPKLKIRLLQIVKRKNKTHE